MHTKQTAGAGGFRCTETPGGVFRDGELQVFTNKSRLQTLFLRGQWSLYRLLARCPGSDDLVGCNPAMAFALANSRGSHPVSKPLDSARRLLRRKQRDILDLLGFPATDRARRILAKIPAEKLSMTALFRLRRDCRATQRPRSGFRT